MTKRPTSRPKIDWLMVRAAFESGELSDRALSRQFKVTPPAIRYRAAKESWRKPARRAASTRKSPVVPAIAVPPAAPEPAATPLIAVAVSPSLADAAAADPKALVERGRDLAGRLLDELHTTSSHVGELEALIEAETENDKDGKRRHAMLQAVGLPTRAAVLKNLALAAKTLSDITTGKKSDAGEAGKKAPSSRFVTPAAPKLVVNNT